LSTAIRAAEVPLYPRGPRSGPGYVVPVHHHLLGPIRPTRRHITTSPHGGLYAMPSLCRSASATRERFRAFTARSFPTCRPLRPRGARRRLMRPLAPPTTLAFASSGQARRSQLLPPSVSSGSLDFGAALVHSFATACRVASLLDGSDRVSPAAETCTSGLSTRRSPFAPPDITTVALGHFPLAGLSPARTAASIAAP